MFILSSIFNCLEFWSNSELKDFKNIYIFGEISDNWQNNLFRVNLYKTLECCWELFLTTLQWTNTTSVIY